MMRLITIPFSHYCEKARWALDYAQVSYREEGHPPLHHYAATLARGAGRTVPVLICNGKVYPDSTPIVALADERATAARKLLPVPPQERAAALSLEDELDRSLGPAARRVAYYHLLREPELCARLFREKVGPVDRALLRVTEGLLTRGIARGLRIDEQGAQRSLERIRAVFTDVGARLAGNARYLGGDRFAVADLTFAALAAPVLLPPEHPGPTASYQEVPAALRALVDELRSTTAGAHAMRMYREHRHG